MTEISKRCEKCGKPLEEIDWNKDYFLHLCMNPSCPARRQPQGSRLKYPESEAWLRGLVR